MPAKTAALPALIALIALLGLTSVASAAILPAAPPTAPKGPPAVAEEGEEGEFEEAEDEAGETEAEEAECEAADQRCLEEEEEEEEEVGDEGLQAVPAAADCMISTADASAAIDPHSGMVRLTIRYASLHPAAVAIDLRLRGARGAVSLGVRAHFDRHGVFRGTLAPGRARLSRVLATTAFSVGVHAVNTPAHCHRLLDERLVERRAHGGRLLWS